MPSLLVTFASCTSNAGTDSAIARSAGTGLTPARQWQGWRPDATLAGRGGDGASLAVWEWPDAGDGRTDGPRIVDIPEPQDQTYNLFWTDQPDLQDLRLVVRFQARAGKVDQGGGPIWRVRDRDHYYICRANPLESNFRLYKVVAGVRTQLASVKVDMPAAKPEQPGRWHTIEVTHVGDSIVCTLDGATRLEATDASITGPGGIGVWTKADAVVWFDGPASGPAR